MTNGITRSVLVTGWSATVKAPGVAYPRTRHVARCDEWPHERPSIRRTGCLSRRARSVP